MVQYDIKQLQQYILNILVTFDKVCREHNLSYYLWAGTMLGAVRHKGFIPWDDDADVAMPREDYDKLMCHADEWLPKPMEITCFEKDHKFTGTFAKMIDGSTTIIERYDFKSIGGIYIDIFPIDRVPSNTFNAKIHLKRYSIIKKLAYFVNRNPYKYGHGYSSWLPRIVQYFYTNEQLQANGIALMKRYDSTDSEMICDYDDGAPGIMPKEYIGEPVPVEFEGHTLMGVAQSDKYLKQKYGDYMVVPEVAKQRQHKFYFLDYNLPYKEYNDTRQFVK